MKYKINFILLILVSFKSYGNKADLVIFSYDRPMQIYALLESIEKYITNLGEIHIICRTSNAKYAKAYQEIEKRFPYKYHKQGKEPHKDFKPLVMQYSFQTPNEYIIYAVDDIIVKDYIDISKCIKTLKETNTYGFYLRLGKNITYCYMMNIHTPVPPHEKVSEDIYKYQFTNGLGDWGYPNCLDMTIYKKSDIKPQIEKLQFKSPELEGQWATIAPLNKFGLFFEDSKILNLPINIIRDTDNKNMKLYTPEELLQKFNQGLKIDINKFYKINNKSPHAEYIPEFIKRTMRNK